MFSATSTFVLTALLAYINPAIAHGTITAVTGANGVQGAGFGIIADTPRNGGLPIPFEQDTSIIRDREINSGKTGVCGRTPKGGNNDVTTQLAAASQAGLPTTSATGELSMTLHQVNQDGAGPYSCDVSADGGNTFQAATVTQNVPGIASLSLSVAQDHPLVMQVPAGMACTGGPTGNACIARCRNSALAGPFGSCVAFAMGGDASAASSNSTASAAQGAAAAAPAAAQAAPAAAQAAPAAAQAAPAAAAGASTGGAQTGNAGGKLGGILGKIFGGGKRDGSPSLNKRVINSRIAGRNAGYWIDA